VIKGLGTKRKKALPPCRRPEPCLWNRSDNRMGGGETHVASSRVTIHDHCNERQRGLDSSNRGGRPKIEKAAQAAGEFKEHLQKNSKGEGRYYSDRPRRARQNSSALG